MALERPKMEGSAADAPQTDELPASETNAIDNLNLDELAQATRRLETEAQAAAVQGLNVRTELDAATDALQKAPDVGKVHMFTCVAYPNETFFIYPNALEMRKRDAGGRINHKPDDPAPVQIKFNTQRFMTTSESLAALIRFSAVAWPSEYGCITASTGRTSGVAERIEMVRKKAALQMSLTGLADINDKPLIDQAARLAQSDNVRAAEDILSAVETIQRTRDNNSHQQSA